MDRFKYQVNENDPETVDVFDALLNGEPVTTSLATRRGTFTMKYPDDQDRKKIMVLIADAKMGRPDDLLDYRDKSDIIGFATLNVTIIDGPPWWKKMGQWEKCPDKKIVQDLLARGRLFRQQVERDIDDSPFGTDMGKPASRNEVSSVGGGAFQDIAYGPKAKGSK